MKLAKAIFDWKRTLYDPDKKELVGGSRELLEFLKSRGVEMVLIGKGGEDMKEELLRMGVADYFLKVEFCEGGKDPAVFEENMPKKRETCVVVGDRVRSELEIGNRLGAVTIWVRQGKFAQEMPGFEAQTPSFTVNSLNECLGLLGQLLK